VDPTLIVLDDFFENASSFRTIALQQDYPVVKEEKGYPGRNSAQKLVVPGLDEQLSRILGTRVREKKTTGHGRFRITLKDDEGAASIHIDECHWTGVLYLTMPEDCSGGTEFYRHIETNTDRALLEQEDLIRLGISSRQEANRLFNEILFNDSKDSTKWERIMNVDMRFNRLILFRPWLWHNAGPSFGDSLENGRLIYLMSLEQY